MKNQDLSTFLDQIEKNISSGSATVTEGVGEINNYKDGVIEISGISDLKMGEIVEVVGTTVKAVVLTLEKNLAKALVLNASTDIKEGFEVKRTNDTLSMPVGESVLGRVVNSLGEAIDGGVAIKQETTLPLERVADGVFSREPVKAPLQTGIVAIDALIPIGRGQRELIIGDRQTGKTTIALDTILSQKGKDVICIYASIGQRESNVSRIYKVLKDNDALDYSIIVSASASTTAMMQFLAPYSATALAEYFLKKGKDVLVVYDDLSKHAVSYREISLLLRRPPGREAYPGDVFYIHSRLLERSVKLNKDFGGGSITSLPIIETQAGDISAYIPTNVISITDGQIFLSSDLLNKGIAPAIDIGNSVSRVGSSAQTKIMKKIAGTLKLDLASYYELESFSQFASDLDENTKSVLNRGKKIVLALTQKMNSPYSLWEEVITIWAVSKGYLDKENETDVTKTLSRLRDFALSKHSKLVNEIEEKKELTEDIEKGITKLMEDYFTK